MDKLDFIIRDCLDRYTPKELALGFLRYEALRKLNPIGFAKLHKRNISGENFDDMVTEMIKK
jgi:hypothetical protein